MKFFHYEKITRDDGRPYLDRLIIFRCRWFSLMLHRFRSSDDAVLHDHPWGFYSLILWGGYWETIREYNRYNWTTKLYEEEDKKTWHGPLSFFYRPAETKHRIEIKPERPPITLVLTGKKIRHWGFWCPQGWVHWRKYEQTHCE